jgi:F-type H+-transporting ATPase subunit alpha
MAQQVSVLYAVLNGYLDDVPVEKVQEFEADFHRYMEGAHSVMLNKIMETKDLDDATTAELIKAIEGFKATTSY